MTAAITNPLELRSRGFQALVKELGWVNAVRFLREYETGGGDRVRERDAILPDWDAETLVKRRSGRARGFDDLEGIGPLTLD